ncbi:MAG: GNAT family N-acetyltransferase [Clostridiales bacterium]|nr:GNAT family N-acetyltransferase [Clostridiales bacterium]
MEELYLREPTIQDEKIVLDFKQEFIEAGEKDKMFGSGSLEKFETFEEWLEKVLKGANPKTVPEGRVPATQYLTFRKRDNKLVGMVNIRHSLTDFLKIHGGHIGDCVRPSERRKGYATIQIKLALEKCKELGIDDVLITCDVNNIGSAKTIQKNAGVLENEVLADNGITYQRYWVDTTREL